MATADTARLIASLELKDKFSPTVNKAIGGLGRLDSRIDRSSSKAHQAGQHIGIGIANAAKLAAVGIGLVASQAALGVRSLIKLEEAEAQTGAVLKSTGQAAGINGEAVTRLAEKYENLNAKVGDEFIRAGQNMLLTFTNIKGKAFEPALEAVLNLNTAMGKGPEGLTKTAILVGKALNDPTKGLTALTRVGVSFTKEQVKRIKGLQKEGKTLEAQKIILAELNKEFGGSFAAQGGTKGGLLAGVADAAEDLQRLLATGLMPVLGKVLPRVRELLISPEFAKGATDLGNSIAGLFSDENINEGANVLRGLFKMAKDSAPTIAAAAQITGSALKVAVDTFRSLPPEIQKLLVAGLAVNKLTGGIVTNIAGGLISSVLKQLVSGVVNVNGGVVNVTGGGLPGAGGRGGIPPIVPVGGAAAVSAIGAGVGTTAAVAIAGTVAAILGADARFGDENDRFQRAGLNAAEVAAMRYYNASSTDQATIAKRLGSVPTRADFASGNAKLAGRIDGSTAAVERMRAGLGAAIAVAGSRTSAASISAGLAATRAGDRTVAAQHGTTRAIDRKTSTVIVNVRNSIREQANAVTSRSTHKIL